jgi:hypothetical protein
VFVSLAAGAGEVEVLDHHSAGLVPVGGGGPGWVRGVLAGLDYARRRPELLGSYLADLDAMGPSAGQLRAGGVASLTSPRVAAWSGGLLCVGAVGLVCLALPGFSRYSNRASLSAAATGPAPAVPPQ